MWRDGGCVWGVHVHAMYATCWSYMRVTRSSELPIMGSVRWLGASGLLIQPDSTYAGLYDASCSIKALQP
jgi:hypothetical protein